MIDLEQYTTLFKKLENAISWTNDRRITNAVASFYYLNSHPFDGKRLLDMSDRLKKEGWTSYLNQTIHYIMAARLAVRQGTPDELLEELLKTYQLLLSHGFKKSMYTYLAALYVMDYPETDLKQAYDLFVAIKSHHPFLTGAEDIPYSVLLSSQEKDPVEQAVIMNKYYQNLKTVKLWQGNELQWLSQVLTSDSIVYNESYIPYIAHIRNQLKEQKIRVSLQHYVLLGMLAIDELDLEAFKQIVYTYWELTKSKLFKWYKEDALTLAILNHLSTKQDASLHQAVSANHLIQMQQLAMLSSVNSTIQLVQSSNS
ncbi:DUF4003 family protein [Chryseomicrobium sp. FSL W7-1435]|uniref:DUF4003 family protein n=1 Tax=Chryseomicrobium sp. FSL W7-1435 TaxID=2921704 RepID=UPI003159A36F